MKIVVAARSAGVSGLSDNDDWTAWNADEMCAAVELLQRKRAARAEPLDRRAGCRRFVFDEESGDAVITDFAGDRIDLTAFGFASSEFDQARDHRRGEVS